MKSHHVLGYLCGLLLLQVGCAGPQSGNAVRQVSQLTDTVAIPVSAPVIDSSKQEHAAADTIRPVDEAPTPRPITHSASDSVWIRALHRIPLPEEIEQRVRINVYLKYKTPINGYVVTARWMPFDATCETGYIVLNFRHKKTGRTFHYINTEKYNNYNTDQISFARDFTGHRNGDLHLLDYPDPMQQSDETYPTDATHPLGYRTPFQFYDVDFDGTNEFLLSDWGQYRGGNQYTAYEIGPHGLEPIDYLPFNQLYTDTEIDRTKRTITLHIEDGANDACTLYFSKSGQPSASPAQLPELPTWSGSRILEEYARAKEHPFRLDSIHAHHNDSLYIYHIH